MRVVRRSLAVGSVTITGAVLLATALVRGQGRAGGPPLGAAPPPATGTIIGRVIDGDSRTPVAGATVRITSPALGNEASTFFAAGVAGGPRSQETSAGGHFLFTSLPKGTYSVDVSAPGYLPGRYGQERPPASIARTLDVSRQVDLADGETKDDLTVLLWKQGVISGTVLDENGEPLVGAVVRTMPVSDIWIGRLSVTGDGVATDDRGMFRFEVTPGDYLVAVGSSFTAMPSAFVDDYFQKIQASSIADSQQAFSRMFDTLNASGVQAPSQTGLQIGDLRVAPTGSIPNRGGALGPGVPIWTNDGGQVFVYPFTYYPTASQSDAATVIAVKSGQERAGVDFQLKPQATARITGHVIGPNGPVGGVGVRLTGDWNRTSSPAVRTDAPASVTDADGAFEFVGVIPGQYVIDVLKVPVVLRTMSSIAISSGAGGTAMGLVSGPGGPPSMEPTLWAVQPVIVGSADVRDLTVSLSTGGRITGHYEFSPAGSAPPPDRIKQIQVTPRALPGTLAARLNVPVSGTAIDETGTFRTAEIAPGPYILNASAPGWTLRSAMVDGKDMADIPVNVDGAGLANVVLTFTNQPTVVTGSVTPEETAPSAPGTPPHTPTVIVFPTDQGYWPKYAFSPRRLRTAAPTSSLTYRVAGLPPGEYFVAASASPVDFTDPAVLALLARTAPRVTLVEGETRTENVHAVAVPAIR